jgi:hypothetical protein
VISLKWINSTDIVVSYRVSVNIDLFDLECCPDWEIDGKPAVPNRTFVSPSIFGGTLAPAPIDICLSSGKDSVWSAARDGKIRMWDVRVSSNKATAEFLASSGSELTSIQV